MSNRQNPNQDRSARRRIVGPQSALTDYLASHNISANQIARDFDSRRRAAAAQQTGDNDGAGDEAPGDTAAATEATEAEEDEAEKLLKQQREKAAIEKIKRTKKFQKRKAKGKGKGGDDDDDDDYDDLARLLYEESRTPLPGQMDNCAKCQKRFTVTPYTRADPSSGLLCNPCGKLLDTGDKDKNSKKRKAKASNGPVGRRRKLQSAMLDGASYLGSKGLMTLCVELLAKNIDLADDLGNLPPPAIDRIARILSKRRLLNPRTLELFVRPDTESISIYDGGSLRNEDVFRVFQTCPSLKSFYIRNGIQFKDEVMDYLTDRHFELEHLYLHGANLVSEEAWLRFLTKKGKYLKTLKILYTDKHVNDRLVKQLPKLCPNLIRLKIAHNQQVTGAGVKALAGMKCLEHLSLRLENDVHSDCFVLLIKKLGSRLRTLSLSCVPNADNTVLVAIRDHCQSLVKLRITESEVMTDAAFADLFENWVNPGLEFIDFEKCRHLDSSSARDNPDNIGLCGEGFKAMMKHSGQWVKRLNLHACRDISTTAFEEVFNETEVFPALKWLELSSCEQVTDFVCGLIFRSCPALHELLVFACMKVRDVRVPRGKLLIGVPNALGMQIEGTDDDIEMN